MTNVMFYFWRIAFCTRPEVGRSPSNIGGTVGSPLRQLGSLLTHDTAMCTRVGAGEMSMKIAA